MQLDEALGQGESETGALARALAGTAHLLELFEDPGLIDGRDANARVAHADLDLTSASPPGHFDPPSVGRELDRIGEQVEDHLADLALVRDDRPEVV